jgi:hypothetical protein
LEEIMLRSVRSLSRFVLCVALAACGDPHAAPPPPAVAVAPPPPQANPAPKPAVDLHLDGGYEMLHPLHDGRLTVIPIVQKTPPAVVPVKYLALEAAMTRHLVTVRELGEWQVDTVRIKNKSNQPIFAMSGELVIDALQDRVIARDTIIPPHASVQVAVRCVEQNREKGGRTFHAGNALAELDLRQSIVHQQQTQVWQMVDAINQRLGLTPPTKTYRLAAQAQPADRAGQLAQQLNALPEHAQIVGLAVAIDGQVQSIDRFVSPDLYEQLEGELVGSYVASDGGPPHEGKTLVPDDIRALSTNPSAVTTTEASLVALQPL